MTKTKRNQITNAVELMFAAIDKTAPDVPLGTVARTFATAVAIGFYRDCLKTGFSADSAHNQLSIYLEETSKVIMASVEGAIDVGEDNAVKILFKEREVA